MARKTQLSDPFAASIGGYHLSSENVLLPRAASLDIFWLKDKSLTDLDNLPEPHVLAEEIIENLEAGLNSFREVLAGLRQADS